MLSSFADFQVVQSAVNLKSWFSYNKAELIHIIITATCAFTCGKRKQA